MSKPFHLSALCRYRVRAAKSLGKLPRLSFDEADALYSELCDIEGAGRTQESSRRLGYLLDALYDQYLRPDTQRHTTLEFRDGTWYQWTLVNGRPTEFRPLDPQPEAPNR